MSTGLFDVKRSMRKTDTGQLSNNPPVHRDNKKTDKQRRKERLAALGVCLFMDVCGGFNGAMWMLYC